MPEISITDNLGNPVDGVTLDATRLSSLMDYAKAEVLHLLVAPDFVERKDQPLAAVAAKPVHFQAKLGHEFPLGTARPELTLTPEVDAVLRADATAGGTLFDDDEFHVAAEIAPGLAYVGMEVTGTLSAGANVQAGNLGFGMTAGGSIAIEYLKAFAVAGAPSFGEAVGQMLSGYTIPAAVKDLARLGPGDACTVTGEGSLEVSGTFDVSAPINPLASVHLPLNPGTLDVKSGMMAGVTATFTLTGSYQVRVRRLAAGKIELSYLQARSKGFEVGFHAAASASVKVGGVDVVSALLGAISRTTAPDELLKSLKPGEADGFRAAVQEGVQHSLQASLDLALTAGDERQIAFQYEIEPAALDEAGIAAVNRALRGVLTDLSGRGIRTLDSVIARASTRGATLKVNLLGIVNLISLSKLMSNCEFLFEPASGDLTIKETAKRQGIAAISDPLRRQEALRKALFESVLVTTTYRAAKAVSLPELDCECLHFVASRGTSAANVRDYLNWFATLGLVAQAEIPALLGQYSGDKTSSCVLRTVFDDAACEQLFLAGGQVRPEEYYREFGREAMRAMLATSTDEVDHTRYRVLDEVTRWAGAVQDGPSPQLRHVIPLDPLDAHFNSALALVTGDVYDIMWWAQSMREAGGALLAVREYLAGREAAELQEDARFKDLRDALQKTMLKVVAQSKARFDQPWGMVALYWAAGTPGTATGRLSAGAWTVTRPA